MKTFTPEELRNAFWGTDKCDDPLQGQLLYAWQDLADFVNNGREPEKPEPEKTDAEKVDEAKMIYAHYKQGPN